MKTDLRRFAPLGLVLSILALLSFIGFLIVKGLALGGVFTPPDANLLNRGIWISLGVVALGLALTAFLDPERARQFLTGRQMQYGSNSLIMLVAFLGILFFINLMAFQNPRTWDLTEGQQHSLALETLATLQTLPEPVTARAYYSSKVSSSDIRALLENFQQNSDGKFTYQIIDPLQNPVSAKNDGLDRDATTVIQMGARKELVNFASEQDLASALVRLMHPEQRVVYFLTGHGERDTETPGDTSYTLVKAALQAKNYTVKQLDLNSDSKISADAKVIVVAGPQKPLLANETALLEDYLVNGGGLIIMEEPRYLTNFGDAPDPLADLLSKWALTLQNDLVVDPGATPPLYVYADPQKYGAHPISEKLRGIASRFLAAQSIQVGSPSQEILLTSLAQTYPDAWGEMDFVSVENQQVSNDPAVDRVGPLVLAVAGENFATQARLVVFGDSEFAGDGPYQSGNGDILINAIDWAAEQEGLISLTPKNNITRTYTPPGTLGLVLIIVTAVCVVPVLVIMAGVLAWYSRRRRG
jgi:ABC-type uncharacterized transport system involved in gliding motility auxiliary subunit